MIATSCSSRTPRSSRRGQAEMLEWFPRLIMLIIATLILVVLVNYYANREVDSARTEMYSLWYRVYYSDIIMYKDAAINRVYPGIIDLAKFNDDSLTKVFATEGATGPRTAMCLWLSSQKTEYNKVICTNKDAVQHWAPIAQAQLKGPGGASMINFTIPITLRDATTTPTIDYAGNLTVVVVRRNS